MPDATIRSAIPDDAEPIRRMQAQSWRETYPSPENGISREWVEKRTAEWFEPFDEKMAESRKMLESAIDDPKQFYRVAESNGQIIGIIHGVVREDNSGHLWAIYTDKSQHGSGLGQRLVAELDEFFDENNVQRVDLEVASYNDRAINFYQKFGFEIVPGSEHFFAEIMPVVNMERRDK
ncbi:GNAT family N-acetyltransferase [Candidatus Saccharibacteria bacterium]|nr:GNAT family N-acetyltransferase [Candidatus Saccharibacteria bacterium]